MRIALLTESGHTGAQRGEGGWCGRLVDGLPEHEFRLYRLLPADRPAPPAGVGGLRGVHELPMGGRRPAGRGPAALRRRGYLKAYEELVRALVMPGEQDGFGPALYRLAALGRGDDALPAFLGSGHAHRVLERIWQTPGADTAGGEPQVCDVLVAADLLEQCLRPLSAPWYGTGPAGLGGTDLCHVVGGGPAALPALVARELHGVPFVVTGNGPHLLAQDGGHRAARYRGPVRALLLSFLRQLAEETRRRAAAPTPGRRRHEDAPAGEPGVPTLVWAGALEPGRDPELMLHAFAQVRAELPDARLAMYGEEGAPGYLAHCEAVAGRLGIADAVEFAGRPESPAAAWASGSAVVFSAPDRHAPRLLADAMLSGRAVVATETGAAREVLGPAGLLVPPRTPRALAGACLALLRDPERRARLGGAGRLRAQERFGVEPTVGAFREIYLELASRYPAFPARPGAPAQPFARPAEYWVAAARPALAEAV
ncbi:glycosyltransferase [Kitasatospora sp. NPDC059795]|uniref:glycosyltransferase n=1 Tax=Kitasatospora sp. NPDC059795 TaxID=3346949 RepID=UPI00366500C0